MKWRFLGVVSAAALTATAMAGPVPSLAISLGTRETGASGAIGDDAGTSGGIEWVNLDGQTLPLDGQWYLFTFDMANDPATPFAGGSANGVVGDTDGDGVMDVFTGSLEHIRIRNIDGFTGNITIWIDDVANTIDPPGPPPPQTVVFGDFEDPNMTNAAGEVMFQEPTFSGSTSGHIDPNGPSLAVRDDTVAHSGIASTRVEWRFIDNDPSRWVRLTTFNRNLLPLGSPLIRYDQNSVVSFWMRAVPEPGTLAMLVVPAVALLRRRR